MYDDIRQEIQSIKNRIAWIEQTLTQQELPNLYNRLNYLEQQLKYIDQQRVYTGNIQNNQYTEEKQQKAQTEYTGQWSQQYNIQSQFNSKKIETNIGKYIIAVLAALMIIASASLFVSMFWGKIGPIGQYAVIMLIGLAMTVFSTLMIIKRSIRNGFTIALSSAGYTVIFLTILFGSINWHLYNVYVAGVLALIWTILISYAANYLRSSIYYIITYLGSIVVLTSIPNVMKYEFGIKDQMIVIFAAIIWFGISEGIRIVSNKNNDRASLIVKIASLFFILYEILLLGAISSTRVHNSIELIMFVVIGLCIALVISAYNININHNLDTVIIIASSLISYICTFEALSEILGYLIYNNVNTAVRLIDVSDALTSLITILLMVGTAIICKKSTLLILASQALFIGICLEKISEVFINQPCILSAITAICIAYIILINKNLVNNRNDQVKLGIIGGIIYIQSLWDCFDGADGGIIYKIVALVIMIIPVAIIYYKSVKALFDENDKLIYDIGRLISLYIFYILSLLFATHTAYNGIKYVHTVVPIILLMILHKLFIVDKGTRKHNIEIAGMLIMSIVLSIITYGITAFENNEIYRIEASALIMMLSLSGLYYSLKNGYTMFSVLQFIGLNITTFMAVALISISDIYLIYSLCGIIISAIMIIIGFKISNKHLRLASLIAMIVYVLKMGTLDIVSMGNTMLAVGTLFLSGVVCFIISYIYNKLDKKYSIKG